MRSQLPTKGLYAITPDISDTALLLTNVEKALLGGAAVIQYRDKISIKKEKNLRANALHKLCLQHSVPLIINDEPELALACQAEGLHLGQSDGSIHAAREMLGDNAIIGVTCHHDVSLAIEAEKQGANYVAFGRFFNSSTKPGAPLATLDTLQQAKKCIRLPIVAIGGLKLSNARSVINAGADFTAIVDGVFLQENITQACQQFTEFF